MHIRHLPGAGSMGTREPAIGPAGACISASLSLRALWVWCPEQLQGGRSQGRSGPRLLGGGSRAGDVGPTCELGCRAVAAASAVTSTRPWSESCASLRLAFVCQLAPLSQAAEAGAADVSAARCPRAPSLEGASGFFSIKSRI